MDEIIKTLSAFGFSPGQILVLGFLFWQYQRLHKAVIAIHNELTAHKVEHVTKTYKTHRR